MAYALDNCGPENGKQNTLFNLILYWSYNKGISFFCTLLFIRQETHVNLPHIFNISGCGAKTCILIRDDQANQGNVNDPNVDDWLLITGAYRNPILINNNVPSNKYVMGSYFCGAGIGRDNRDQGKQ